MKCPPSVSTMWFVYASTVPLSATIYTFDAAIRLCVIFLQGMLCVGVGRWNWVCALMVLLVSLSVCLSGFAGEVPLVSDVRGWARSFDRRVESRL